MSGVWWRCIGFGLVVGSLSVVKSVVGVRLGCSLSVVGIVVEVHFGCGQMVWSLSVVGHVAVVHLVH